MLKVLEQKCEKCCEVQEITTVTRSTVLLLKCSINIKQISPPTAIIDYRAPKSKLAAVGPISFIMDMEIFQILDTLQPTAAGLDGILAWFLRIGAPVFAVPLAFKQSMVEGAVPSQWRTAVITLTAKVPKPTQAAHYTPISIMLFLLQSLEASLVDVLFLSVDQT